MARHPDPSLNEARRQRDAAIRRVSRVRGMTIVGAGALTAAVAAGVAAAAPGHTLGATHTHTATTPSSPSTTSPLHRLRMPALADPARLGLPSGNENSPAPNAPAPQAAPPAPQAAPQPAPAAPQPAPASGGGVVSGGS
jgi:hypothetical protein